jgi:hypothetical protein
LSGVEARRIENQRGQPGRRAAEEIAEHGLDWARPALRHIVTILQPATPFVEPATIDACLGEIRVVDAWDASPDGFSITPLAGSR